MDGGKIQDTRMELIAPRGLRLETGSKWRAQKGDFSKLTLDDLFEGKYRSKKAVRSLTMSPLPARCATRRPALRTARHHCIIALKPSRRSAPSEREKPAQRTRFLGSRLVGGDLIAKRA